MGKETRMKRYDDVNIIKAYACLAVFGSHWFGTFGSWGSNKVNALMEIELRFPCSAMEPSGLVFFDDQRNADSR